MGDAPPEPRSPSRARRLARWLLAPGLTLLALLVFVGACLTMPGRSLEGPLPTLDAEEQARATLLSRHVEALATTLGERNVSRAPGQLAAAADYVIAELEASGYDVRRERYTVDGVEVENLIAELPGSAEIVVIGAHYDSAVGTPGADDNASGVAALLVLARELRTRQPRRTLRFVAFTNEEPPWFHGPEMGARHHARAAKARGDEIVAMLSLESIGYYRDEPGSQRYPAPFGAFYPDRGDFLMFVGNVASTGLVRRSVKAFRSARRFPSEGAAVPASIPGVDWSDHRAFWEEGYKALMITDTAPNRNPRYHEPDDTADTVDVARLSLVVSGLRAVIEALAGA